MTGLNSAGNYLVDASSPATRQSVRSSSLRDVNVEPPFNCTPLEDQLVCQRALFDVTRPSDFNLSEKQHAAGQVVLVR
jgi:hypothetical protein